MFGWFIYYLAKFCTILDILRQIVIVINDQQLNRSIAIWSHC